MKYVNRKSLGYALVLATLLITVPRYTETFMGIDRWPVTALGMGLLLAIGAAYILDAWADATFKRKLKRPTWPLLLAFAVNLAYEPFIITPYVLARLWGLPLAAVMTTGYAVFWAIVVAAAPVVLVGGIVLAISFRKDSHDGSLAAKTNLLTCETCGKRFAFPGKYSDRRAAQNALNAHRRTHRKETS